MQKIIQKSVLQIENISLKFKRYLFNEIDWNFRLISIHGARGVGKTTLILQYLKEKQYSPEKAIYVSLDNLHFTTNTLSDFTDNFVKFGGKYLFLDEVHKYSNWSREIKNIYDTYKNLQIVFTSSSILELHKGEVDLSRRAAIYYLNELSIREYIELNQGLKLPIYELSDILENHHQISKELKKQLTPIALFHEYLKFGAYPFINEGKTLFYKRLNSAINQIIENDINAVINIEYSTIIKIKKLLKIIAESPPFKPNITKLSEKIGTSREKLLKYLEYLDKAQLISLLKRDTKGMSYLSKPEKIFLNNSTIMNALSPEEPEIGTLREIFFFNQLAVKNKVNYSSKGDFLVNNKYTFEVGGKNKTKKQIVGVPDSYIVADNIEFGFQNKIPIWLFGFLY